ncbi:putative triglyceride lipase-cholesterol esterase [Neoconidiobolus thromboides FSU 785]|nr:putative triglyceride lipase-cholesterol esterase [Neoconidiobolus thromboides FSU 785]
MLKIPVISRLDIYDYFSLLFTFSFFLFEKVLRFVLFFIPFNIFKKSSKNDKEAKIDTLNTTKDIVTSWGYPFQEFLVTTEDGYLLSVHRIPEASPKTPTREFPTPEISQIQFNIKKSKVNKPVVLLWHGFLMSSEVFVCKPNLLDNLAFWLVEQGYDVWLGNTRGNKYSQKHTTLSPLTQEFWDFSMDEFARYDLPSTVDMILKITGANALAYIGFSQGTAQAFASLSIHNDLNAKINLFICLAPATSPTGLVNNTVDAIVRATPNIIYLMFGRKSALSACLFWQGLLPRALFVKAIDASMKFLFGWKSHNMSDLTKHYCYQHLYSMTSVKCLVHWFQIIRANRFQLYDDLPLPVMESESSRSHVVPGYPTSQIQTPLAVFYGEADTLSDMSQLLSQLPAPIFCKGIKGFEHLDFLWADDMPNHCFEEMAELLLRYNIVEFEGASNDKKLITSK